MRIGAAALFLAHSLSLVISSLAIPLSHDHVEDSLTVDNFMAMAVSTGQSCSTGPIAVQLRISACFSLSEVATIDSWVGKSLAAIPQSYYVNDNAIKVSFAAALASSVSNNCASDSIEKTGAQLSSSLQFMTSQVIASPTVVISFFKDSTAVSSLSTTPGYHLKVRICSTCSPQSNEVVISSLALLDSTLSTPVIARYFPCSTTAGSVAVPYVGANSQLQCLCACPAGTTLTSGVCQQNAVSGSDQCYWIGNSSTGPTCKSTKSDSTTLKLITDCAVAYSLPTDNYVADGRVNAYDSQTPLKNPFITVQSGLNGSAVTTAVSKTWKDFMTSTAQNLDAVTFSGFGVYLIGLTASDYSSSISCSGCVAVVDASPPQVLTQCATSSWGSTSTNPTNLTTTSQAEAITKETSFISFDAASNVKNNFGGSYFGDKTRTMRNFYSDIYSTLSSDSDTCFNSNLVRNLLDHASTVTNPLSAGLTEDALSALSCTRCCNKTTTLQEYYYDYKCGQDSANAEKKTAAGDSCSFQHCIRVQSTSLVDVSTRISASANTTSTGILTNLISPTTTTLDGKTVHLTVPCTTFGTSCSTSATLGSLFSLSSAWKADFPGSQGTALSYDVTKYVFWRYKVGSGAWKVWDASASLTFSSASTAITVQAWTHCGFVQETSFTIAVHLHATRNTCSSFSTMWKQIPASTASSSTMCTYGNSTFAAMNFAYAGVTQVITAADTVKASFKSVNCSIRVTDSVTNIANVAATTMNVTTGSSGGAVSEYFAVEQVTFTTSTTTNARIDCSFAFHPYGIATTDSTWDERDTCTHSIAITNCGVDSSSSICDFTGNGKCSSTTSTGARKACAGAIYTAYNSSVTVSTSPLACCTNCKKITGNTAEALLCTTLTEVSSTYTNPLKRCVLQSMLPGGLLLANLALGRQETNLLDAQALTSAAANIVFQDEESWIPSYLVLLVAVSAFAALVVIVVPRASSTSNCELDEGYRPLLD